MIVPQLGGGGEQLAPYDERKAALDALEGKAACEHGIWPHMGTCGRCPDHDSILRLARAILLPPRQATRAPALTAKSAPAPGIRPYDTRGAALDALEGKAACEHGIWPHQGRCPDCRSREKVIQFTFDGLFPREVQ